MRTYFSSHLRKSDLLFILLAFAFTAYAFAATPAGRVDFAFGQVTATAADKTARTLAKGADIFSGDSIATTDGRAQLRFSDGAYVSLQPNTVFKVDQYLYEGKSDGKEKASFSLVKGSLRTITGAIGKVNKQNYEVRTPTATIGIRGTSYSANQSDDGLVVTVAQGLVSVSNQGGSMTLAAGQSALVRTPTSSPEMTNPAAPTSSIAPVNPIAQTQNQEQFPMLPPSTATIAGEQRTPDGTSLPLATVALTTVASSPTNGPGYAVSWATTIFGDSLSDSDDSVTTTFSGEDLIAFNTTNGSYSNISASASQVRDSGWDGLIGWGRWVGTTSGMAGGSEFPAFSENEGFHYAVGQISSIEALATRADTIATYGFVGATSPSTTDPSGGITTLGTFNGNLSINFGPSPTMTMNVMITTDGDNGSHYDLSSAGPLMIYGPLAPSFTASTNDIVPVVGMSDGGSIDVNGFFVGSAAERLGISYVIQDAAAQTTTTGSAAFKAP